MTDPRPNPQYGEYAPPGWVSPVPPPAPPETPEQDVAQAQPVRRRRAWDLFITVALLAVGVFNVVSGYWTFGNLPQTIGELYKSQGIGVYTEATLAQTIGIAISVSQSVILLVTIWVSYLALKKNRLAFYWPLIGFALTMLVTLVLIVVAMFGDPAFMSYVNAQTG